MELGSPRVRFEAGAGHALYVSAACGLRLADVHLIMPRGRDLFGKETAIPGELLWTFHVDDDESALFKGCDMLVSEAQREVRSVYLGGFVGQLVSAAIWLVSAAVTSFVDYKTGFWTLAIGGVFIFPLTQLILRAVRGPKELSKENPLHYLGMQIAFTVPFVLPVAGALALYRPVWFYPACMIIVGAHYLPFVFLYGMKTFAALAAALLAAGFALGMLAPDHLLLGGWVGGGILFMFAFVLLMAFRSGSEE